MTILLDAPGTSGYGSHVPDLTSELHPDDLHPHEKTLAAWLREDPDLLRRAAYAVTDAAGRRSADGEDEVQDVLMQMHAGDGDEFGPLDDAWFASAAEAQHWLTATASLRVRTRRGLVSVADVADVVTRVGSPDALEAGVDARPLVSYAGKRAGPRANTLLACIRQDITFREAGLELDLTRQRAQQCASTLLAQLRKHQRAQEAMCACR